MYRADQWKVLEILGAAAPKRPYLKTSEIAKKGFNRREDPDRCVRNAFRKLRVEEHIEIGERGMYRITAKGMSFLTKSKKAGYKPLPARKKSEKPAKKAKAVKKAKPAKTKAVKAKAAPKKVAKSAKKAKPVKAASKSNGSSNGASKKVKTVATPLPKGNSKADVRAALSI